MSVARVQSLTAATPFAFRQGRFHVTVLSDGGFPLPASVVAPDASPLEWRAIERRLGGRAGSVEAKANIPVIQAGDELMLVDLGGGGKYQPTEGKLVRAFNDAGLDRMAVTKVLLTHAHPDHLWGMLDAEGRPHFPNAEYVIGEAEWSFWMKPDFASAMPPALHPFAVGTRRDLSAVADRIVKIGDAAEIVPGLSAIATPGHTPGHLSYALAGARTLVVTGDVVTNEIVSFEHPDWHFGNDTDQAKAAVTRRRFVDRAANEHLWLLGYHFAYPGLGRAEKAGQAFRFIPDLA